MRGVPFSYRCVTIGTLTFHKKLVVLLDVFIPRLTPSASLGICPRVPEPRRGKDCRNRPPVAEPDSGTVPGGRPGARGGIAARHRGKGRRERARHFKAVSAAAHWHGGPGGGVSRAARLDISAPEDFRPGGPIL